MNKKGESKSGVLWLVLIVAAVLAYLVFSGGGSKQVSLSDLGKPADLTGKSEPS